MADGMSFSVLFGTSRASADLVSIAVNATRAGFAVLPVHPGDKKPMCTLTPTQRVRADKQAAAVAKEAGHRAWATKRHDCGFHHAITDDKAASRIFKRLYEEHPELNLALEVGRSRLITIDADNAADVEEFTALWAQESGQPLLKYVQPTVSSPGVYDTTAETWTHKGGGHFHFLLPDDVDFSDAPTADPLKFGGAVAYFKDRVLLVPPSVRPEGPYVLNSDIGVAPEWLVEAVRRHIEGNVERRKIQREKIHEDGDPIDVWSVDTPWAELLEPDGWTQAHRFDSCGCECWTRPGPASNPKSLTAHEPGCTRWDTSTTGHGFAHVWTDEPPTWLRRYIDSTGSRSLSKLQWVAWRDHDGKITDAMRGLDLSSTRKPVDPRDLLGPPAPGDSPGGSATDPKDEGTGEVPATNPFSLVVDQEEPESDDNPLRARMYTASRLETIPPPIWLIKGWLTTDALARMSGSPGSWKSFVALDMACCIATGVEYHGNRVKQGKVLYVAAEGVSGIRKRIKAWRLAHPDVEWVEENMIVLAGAVHAKEAQEWADLCLINRADTYSMIVLDTQARITSGMEENSNTDMSVFVERMDLLRQQADTLVMAIHHTGHEGKRGRGASSMWGAMDIDMFLDRDKEADQATLSFIKSKESPEDSTMVFEPTEHPLGTDEDGEPITSLTLHLAAEKGPSEGSVVWWIEFLDNQGLPNDAGAPKARQAIKGAGLKIDNNLLAEVIKKRKNRDLPHGLIGGTDPDDVGEEGNVA